ncbi:MAG: ribonuclease P protein component [Alphaproteobacteria bacterium]|nr:ribonuclease P protein component [Alphaproteobacteria bacterium]
MTVAGAVAGLKIRREFLDVAASGRKFVTPGAVVQVRAWTGGAGASTTEPRCRLGLTASRKVGNAVRRNRSRRRLREAARVVLAEGIAQGWAAGHDIVLIARADTAARGWPLLLDDLRRALGALCRGSSKDKREAGRDPGPRDAERKSAGSSSPGAAATRAARQRGGSDA